MLAELSVTDELKKYIALCAVHGSKVVDQDTFTSTQVSMFFTIFSSVDDQPIATKSDGTYIPRSTIMTFTKSNPRHDEIARKEIRDSLEQILRQWRRPTRTEYVSAAIPAYGSMRSGFWNDSHPLIFA